MNDPVAELADLAADLRTLLKARQRDGWRTEGMGAPSLEPAATASPSVASPPPPAADALGAQGLRQIRDDLGDCQRCALGQGRRNLVFGVGDPQADLVVIGEAPGDQEDQAGEPFIGPAGQMLDKMLVHVLGLRREQCHILNVVKCRPPDNRKPLADEVSTCMPFLQRQIRAIQPKVILALGTVALKSLFDTDAGITRHRGSWREYQGVPTLPTFHPAYLLHRPSEKRKVFEDLKQLRLRYDELGGRR